MKQGREGSFQVDFYKIWMTAKLAVPLGLTALALVGILNDREPPIPCNEAISRTVEGQTQGALSVECDTRKFVPQISESLNLALGRSSQ